MNKYVSLIAGAAIMLSASLMAANSVSQDVKCPCTKPWKPGKDESSSACTWIHAPDVAMYGLADWSNMVKKVSGVTVEEAKSIASKDKRITFFFYTKGGQMVLGSQDPTLLRIFRHGDAVFFKGEPWWGEAKDLADGYIKE